MAIPSSSAKTEDVQSGGASTSATISSGGAEDVLPGGGASGTVVSNGGQQQVSGSSKDSGTTVGTVVSSGGFEGVSSGGVASGTLVSNSGMLEVTGNFSGSGTAIGTVVENGGTISVGDGGVASSTLIQQGGTLSITGFSVPGAAFDTNVFGDENASGFFASTTSDTIESGGVENVTSGGGAIDTIVAVGGSLIISDNASGTGDTIESGGTLELSGTTSVNATLDAGATLIVGAGAVVEVTTDPTQLIVLAGNGTITDNGATLQIASGGTEAHGAGLTFTDRPARAFPTQFAFQYSPTRTE